MISEKQTIRISKFLSLVLRHQPATIGIELDQNGWAEIDELLEKSNNHGIQLTREQLNHIVETNIKKRFSFNSTFDKMRASQGHSVEIELGYTSQKPPALLFHGTGEKSVSSILKTGILRQNRQHVHLCADIETAFAVGKRHGRPLVFSVLAQDMYIDKYAFYISDNGVWLTDHVPSKYLKQNE